MPALGKTTLNDVVARLYVHRYLLSDVVARLYVHRYLLSDVVARLYVHRYLLSDIVAGLYIYRYFLSDIVARLYVTYVTPFYINITKSMKKFRKCISHRSQSALLFGKTSLVFHLLSTFINAYLYSACWVKIAADDVSKCFSYLSQKIWLDISCTVSLGDNFQEM